MESDPSNRQQPTLSEQIRDSIIASAPEFTDLIKGRDAVVSAYCDAKGISRDDISMDQVLEIRSLPEWQNPLDLQ